MTGVQVLAAEFKGDGDVAEAANASRFYRPELDGLRFLAFLLVFLSHCFYLQDDAGKSKIADAVHHVLAGGVFGVDLFFVLSAYLITELFRREKLATGVIDIPAFYMRRVLRIWPLYFAFVLFWFAVRSFSPPPIVFPVPALFAFLALAGNWYMVALGGPFHSPVQVLWSVSVEEQFYLIWPLLIRFASRARLLGFACLLGAASFAMQSVLFAKGSLFLAIWYNSLVHGGAIAVGILSALLLAGRAPRIHKYLRMLMLLAALPLFGLGDACLHSAIDGQVTTANGVLAFSSGLVGVTLFFYALLGAPADGLQFETRKWLLYLGRISYGLYVFHYAVLDGVKLVFTHFTGHDPAVAKVTVGFAVTLALAAASYRWFESPFLKLKRKFAHVQSGAV